MSEKCTQNDCVHDTPKCDKAYKWSMFLEDIQRVLYRHNIDGENFHLRADNGLFVAMVVMREKEDG